MSASCHCTNGNCLDHFTHHPGNQNNSLFHKCNLHSKSHVIPQMHPASICQPIALASEITCHFADAPHFSFSTSDAAPSQEVHPRDQSVGTCITCKLDSCTTMGTSAMALLLIDPLCCHASMSDPGHQLVLRPCQCHFDQCPLPQLHGQHVDATKVGLALIKV